MSVPKRVSVVVLSFLGFLIVFGFRTVFTMVMVYVIIDNDSDDVTFVECTINGTAYDLRLDWSVATSQYFNTAYFVGYVITQVPGGFLALRFSPTKILGGSIFLSGSCFLVLAFLMQYSTIIVFAIRFIQGLAEGVCQPALSSILSAWAPVSERAGIVGFSYSGVYLSTTLASVVTGVATCYISWNAGLLIYGSMAVVLSIVWLCTIYDTPEQYPYLSEKERRVYEDEGSNMQKASAVMARSIPWKGIFTSLPVWALLLANVTRSWVFATTVTEIPQYFADVFKLSVATIGFLTSIPPILMSVFIVLSGILMDKLIQKKKISTTTGRKLSLLIGFGPEAVIVIALGFVKNYTAAIVLLIIAEGLAGFGIAAYRVNPLDLSPQYASILTGVTRLGQFGGSISTTLAGALREKNAESWQKILIITGSVHLFAVVIFTIFGSGKEQKWAQSGYEPITSNGAQKHNYGSTTTSSSSNQFLLNGAFISDKPS